MCNATKRKIADCVKQLMKKKEIRKITIQDIMDATNMSRQSFYYHFKDIYDVLEWIVKYDFTERITCEKGWTLEDWTIHMLHVLAEERGFFERLVSQVEWPRLVNLVSEPIEAQMHLFLAGDRTRVDAADDASFDFCVKFVTNAYCYYMLDYIYHKKHKSDEQIRSEVHSLTLLTSNQPFLCNVDLPRIHARMVG